MMLRQGIIICLLFGFTISQEKFEQDENKHYFTITTTWDGKELPESQYVNISLQAVEESMDIIFRIDSPYYGDPAPDGEPSQPFLGLWDYEVVEIFFLNKNNQYLEVEIGPHGQHIVLLLNGERNTIRHSLPLNVTTTIENSTWSGEATIPGDYFPPQVDKLNAYSIYGQDKDRQYMALYPANENATKPDFHNLAFFQPVDMESINSLHNENNTELSPVWDAAIKGRSQFARRVFKYKISKQWNAFRSNIPSTKATLQGFEGGVEVNFTMPENEDPYPAESFVVVFENAKGEATKIQLFADGNYYIEFLADRKRKINTQKYFLDYRIDKTNNMIIKGSALVPPKYFPPNVNLMNMYSLFGVETMVAMTLKPVDAEGEVTFKPNLNNIEHFRPIDFDLLVESNNDYSNEWRRLLNLPLAKDNEDEKIYVAVEMTTDVTTIFELEEQLQIDIEQTNQTTEKPEEELTDLEPTTDSSVTEVITEVSEQKAEKSEDLENQEVQEQPQKLQRRRQPYQERRQHQQRRRQQTQNVEHSLIEQPGKVAKEPQETRGLVSENAEEQSIKVDKILAEPSNAVNEDRSRTEGGTWGDSSTTQDKRVFQGTFNQPLRYLLRKKNPTIEREDSPRRYEESVNSDKNEVPITFKLTFKSEDTKEIASQGLIQSGDPEEVQMKEQIHSAKGAQLEEKISRAKGAQLEEKISSAKGAQMEKISSVKEGVQMEEKISSVKEESPTDVIGDIDTSTNAITDGLLPPPHPICFTEGLLPDTFRCQIFHECVIEDGDWRVYSWRCKRGSFFDAEKIACVRGYC